MYKNQAYFDLNSTLSRSLVEVRQSENKIANNRFVVRFPQDIIFAFRRECGATCTIPDVGSNVIQLSMYSLIAPCPPVFELLCIERVTQGKA
jgi:hypothetical protein